MMDQPASKPDGTEPVVDTRQRCGKCGYNLTGILSPPRCPECGVQWPNQPRADEFGTRFPLLVWLNVATVAAVVLMLLIPKGRDSPLLMIMPLPGGVFVRLILFAVQWFLVRTTIRFAMKLNARKEEAISLYLWGLVIPVAIAALTLYFGGEILQFEGLVALFSR